MWEKLTKKLKKTKGQHSKKLKGRVEAKTN